jgi:hypothetical protein
MESDAGANVLDEDLLTAETGLSSGSGFELNIHGS